jgi:hypothetical protein
VNYAFDLGYIIRRNVKRDLLFGLPTQDQPAPFDVFLP